MPSLPHQTPESERKNRRRGSGRLTKVETLDQNTVGLQRLAFLSAAAESPEC